MLALFTSLVMFVGIVPIHTVAAAATTYASPKPGCTILGIEGKYITQIQQALDRINEIRREACNEGVKNPDTGKPLTSGDYVPLQWSSDLEYIARIRAAESSITMGHKRLNGDEGNIWFAGPKGISSNAEVIAWYWGETMTTGIDLWYSEKSAWVKGTGGVTGHYTSMISPINHYVGLGTFCSETPSYYNTTVGEFSSLNNLDTSRGSSTGTIIQPIEVKNDFISYEIASPNNVHDSDKISVTATVTYDKKKTYGLVLPDDTAKKDSMEFV